MISNKYLKIFVILIFGILLINGVFGVNQVDKICCGIEARFMPIFEIFFILLAFIAAALSEAHKK